METAETTVDTTKDAGAVSMSPASAGSAGPWKFPVNRHDEPRLYPGSTRYEGFAALFTLDDGTEFAVLAPTLDALDAAVQANGIRNDGEPVDRERCVQIEIKRMPNKALMDSASKQ
jgi:hypothetical protein